MTPFAVMHNKQDQMLAASYPPHVLMHVTHLASPYSTGRSIVIAPPNRSRGAMEVISRAMSFSTLSDVQSLE